MNIHRRQMVSLTASCLITTGLGWFALTAFAQEEHDEAEQQHSAERWMEFIEGGEKAFDGQSLDGWRGYKQEAVKGWTIDDGSLHRQADGGDIMTIKEYKNFALSLEWKVAEGGNSGIMYRVRQGDGAPYMSGVEYQVLDNERHHDGKSELTAAGSLYAMYPSVKAACRPAGEWNKTIIVVVDNHIEHWLNGKLMVEAQMWGDDWKKRFEESKFAGWTMFGKSPQGHIALQDHGDQVWFRDIMIKEITDTEIKMWHEKHGVHEHHAEEAASK